MISLLLEQCLASLLLCLHPLSLLPVAFTFFRLTVFFMILIQERSGALAEVSDARTRAETNIKVLQVTKCNYISYACKHEL